MNNDELSKHRHIHKHFGGSRPECRRLLPKGTKIGKYQIEACIGQGGFGDIYGATFFNNSKIYALKLESIKYAKHKSYLFNEMQYLQLLQDSLDFPLYIDSGITTKYRYLVMELLGPSVSNVRRELGRHKFSLSTTLRLAMKMLRCIENVHNHGILHCDIKPGNFLLRPDNLNFLVLVDFGLAQMYIDHNEHKPPKDHVGFNGTLKYAVNSMRENSLSRKDDLISWLYSVYEIKIGKLPWDGIEKKQMKIMKKDFPNSKYFSTLPSEFHLIYDYITNLGYYDKPDYNYINDIILKIMLRKSMYMTEPYDWEHLSKNHILSFSPIAELPKSTWCRVPEPKPVLSRPGHANPDFIHSTLFKLCCLCCCDC